MPSDPRVAVVLAGGEGRRLQPYTTVLPKPLMPLGEKSILEIVLRQLAAHGFDEAVLAVGYLAELIEAFVGDGSRFGIDVRYSRESGKLGTAGPLANISDLPEAFLVMNGDILTDLDYRALFDHHIESDPAATVAVFRREQVIDFGVVDVGSDGMLESYTEKPVVTHLVSSGVNVLSKRAVEIIPEGKYYDLPTLIQDLMARGESVAAYPFEGSWLDIGRHDDYEEAIESFATNPETYLAGGRQD